ncbi:hypothetical protein [Clostridium cellulovorans]|uniref:Pectate lyase superfamily protein domain-containing protein n=2 Tax=Clostridium cellulovorans TaxID=1493 RepID=D9SPG5_CLOC7|nr:hypothetical protein [Clostridium cellulovorans]ADL50014.1 hypothetical protein Clocel_0230 [Clostridium cellulovorans 743B]BAV13169.1 exopolygalacturonate lyase [Clostridium cellulovorans]
MKNKSINKEIIFLIVSVIAFVAMYIFAFVIKPKPVKNAGQEVVIATEKDAPDNSEVKENDQQDNSEATEEEKKTNREIGHYPAVSGEVGVLDEKYSYGDVRRYGIIPDKDTIWHNTQYINNAFNNGSKLGFEVFFPKGFYKTQLNISQSNLTLDFEEGSEVTGGVYIYTIDNQNKIKNVTIKGTIVTYDRFAATNTDTLIVDTIYVKGDGSKATDYPGIRGRGVHIYKGTTNMRCKSIIIDDIDGNGENNCAAVQIDGYVENPSNLSIDKIWVKKSDVHGVYLTGNGHKIGEIQVDEFGAGANKQPQPIEDSDDLEQSQELKGVWINRCADTKIGKITVKNPDETRKNVKYDVLLDETGKGANTKGVEIGEIISNPMGKSLGVAINDKNYPGKQCIYKIGTITIATDRKDKHFVNINSKAQATIETININDSALVQNDSDESTISNIKTN